MDASSLSSATKILILPAKAYGILKVHKSQLVKQSDAYCHRMQTWLMAFLAVTKHRKSSHQGYGGSTCTSTPTLVQAVLFLLNVARLAALGVQPIIFKHQISQRLAKLFPCSNK